MGFAIIMAKKMALGMGISKSEAKKAAEDAEVEEERKRLASEAAGEGGKSDEGGSAGNVVYNMDAEAVRQLRMGFGWVFLIRGDSGWIVLAYQLDCTISSGSYRISWILSYFLYCIRKPWLLCAGWLLTGCYRWVGWNGWGVGGTGVGWTGVSRRRNRSTTVGAVTGAPPLALEGRRDVVSGGWYQFRKCFKVADYLCRISKIIQIDCTKIGTNT